MIGITVKQKDPRRGGYPDGRGVFGKVKVWLTIGRMERGKPIPSINISDHTGKVHPLKDYNQKTHIAVVCDPQAKPAELQAHATAAEVMGKTWTWLNVKVLVTDGGPHGLERGVYAIDRYSRLIETFPIKNDFWALLEKEFLYYEARHC